MADQYPASEISLRNASASRFILQANFDGRPKTIGFVDGESAFWMAHPNAIYLHEGETYLVEDLDLESETVTLQPILADYYTRPQQETEVQLLEISGSESKPESTKSYGEIAVNSQVVGYQKLQWGTNENLGCGEVDLPVTKLQTTGYWLTLSDKIVEKLRAEGLWTNDSNAYGPSWPEIRNRVRKRDHFTCQICGLPEGKQSHHIHHKIPFRVFDSPVEANRLENLITLCPACHQRAESVVKIRGGLSGLAHILGNLAPLFLMCDHRDLGSHTDPKSPLGDGKPTVVIYEKIPGGIGFSQHLFEVHNKLLMSANELVSNCLCKNGCPACVGPGGAEGAGSKLETLGIIKELTKSSAPLF